MGASGPSAGAPPPGRMLGVDPGTKRIGLALSDELGMLASPHEVWLKKTLAEDVAHVAQVVREHGVVRVVVGVPYRLDGSKGPAAEKSLSFIAALRPVIPAEIPVVERDEALTTWEAEAILKDRGLSPQERRGKIDAYAAAVILQEELDALDAARRPTPRAEADEEAFERPSE